MDRAGDGVVHSAGLSTSGWLSTGGRARSRFVGAIGLHGGMSERRAARRGRLPSSPDSSATRRAPPGCARTSGGRSRRWSPTAAGRWSCSAPAGASRRCTSSPPRCCARAAAGPTVIVSPLLALMRNQVEAAARAGIRARTINSANPEEWDARPGRGRGAARSTCCWSARSGSTTPTSATRCCPSWPPPPACWWSTRRTASPTGATTSGPTTAGCAPCSPSCPPGVPVLATTATANARVTADVAEQLGTGGAATDALVLRGPLDRESLRLGVLRLPDAAHRLAWLAEHLDELPGSGIIYTLTVAAAEEVTAFLRQRGLHGGLLHRAGPRTPTGSRPRTDLLANRVKALVATSALGMGFDKPDLGLRGAPRLAVLARSPTTSRSGRAGRGVEHAEVLLLPGPGGRGDLARTSPRWPSRRRSRCARTLDVAGGGGPAAVAAGAGAAGGPAPLPAGDDAQGARRGRRGHAGCKGGWIADRAAVGVRRASATPGWRGSARPSSRRCATTRRRPAAGWSSCGGSWTTRRRRPCGRCDNCAGRPVRRRRLRRRAGRGARRSWAGPGVEVEPRRMWPTGLPAVGVDLKGRIPAGRAGRDRAGPWAGSPTSAGATGCARCSRRRPRRAGARRRARGRGGGARRLGEGPRRLGLGCAGRPAAPGRGGHRRLAHPAAAGRLARRADRRGRPAAAARPRELRRTSGGTRCRAATAPSGCARCTGRSVPPELAGRWRRAGGPVLLVDDYHGDAAGRWPSPPGCCGGPGRRRCCRWSWPCRAERGVSGPCARKTGGYTAYRPIPVGARQLLVAACRCGRKNWSRSPHGSPWSGRALPRCALPAPPRPQCGRVAEGRTVTFGFAPSAAASTSRRCPPVRPTGWPGCWNPPSGPRRAFRCCAIPREVVSGLHARHRPTPSTAVVAVLDRDERLRGERLVRPAVRRSADGWEFRNALLAQLRRVIPHDLRRRTPGAHRRAAATAVRASAAGRRRTAPGCGGCGTPAPCTVCAAGPTSR